LIACAIAALALGSGLIGALTAPKGGAIASATGPFSYFPHS
jgi:hypothetical protein